MHARLQTIGVDSGKEEIVNRLLVNVVGPGYCHFPKLENGAVTRGYDEEYFKGLTAERRITKSKHGFRTYIWIKRLSQRNEPFDCRNYALAALVMPWVGIDLDKMKRDEYKEPKNQAPTQFGARQAQTATERQTSIPGSSKFGAQNKPLW